jgi:putative tryptophan/tyrosine transport system substrate-binding protein
VLEPERGIRHVRSWRTADLGLRLALIASGVTDRPISDMSGLHLLRCTALNRLQDLLYLVCDRWPWGKSMRRREFITLLGGGAVTWPFAGRAQQPGKVVRIGFLGPAIDRPSSMFVPNYQAFLAQLRVLGFIEGQNLIVTYGAVDDPRGLPVVATELMQVQPELIVVSGTEPMLQAVRTANYTIPIVLIAVNFDPISRGYVASLARPGGNITGVVFQQLELAQKQVELLTQAFPGRTHLAVLFDAQSADQFMAAERSAKSLNLQIRGYKPETLPYDFDAAFQSVLAGGAQMVLVQSSPHFIPHQVQIGELAKAHRLPTMFLNRPYVETGGLMSYGADFPPMYRRVAEYVAKILKGGETWRFADRAGHKIRDGHQP